MNFDDKVIKKENVNYNTVSKCSKADDCSCDCATCGIQYPYQQNDNKQPFKCPVCLGKGIVSNGFYDTDTTKYYGTNGLSCRTCSGTGVVWG